MLTGVKAFINLQYEKQFRVSSAKEVYGSWGHSGTHHHNFIKTNVFFKHSSYFWRTQNLLLAEFKICNSCKNTSLQINVKFPLLFSGVHCPVTCCNANLTDVQFVLILPGTPVQQLMKMQKLVFWFLILGTLTLLIDSLGQISWNT